MLVKDQRVINKEDTDKLIREINDNDLRNIPTVNESGLDGVVVFIEGYSDRKEYFKHKFCPRGENGVYKIYKTFDDYSGKIASNPLKDYELKYFPQ